MNSLIRKMICVGAALTVAASACAQLTLGKSAYQEMIEESLKPALFVAKSSFRISNKENNNLYGYKGNDEFGIQYSLGVFVDGAFVLTSPAVRPWQYDSNFAKYTDEYDPVLYKTQMAWLNQPSNFVDYEQNIETPQAETAVFVLNWEAPYDRQLSTDDTKGQKSGWLVWVVGDPAKDNWEMLVYREEVNVEGMSSPVDVKRPITDKKVLGGLFVVPSFPIAGEICLSAVGVVDFKDGAWKLYFPFTMEGQPKQEDDSDKGILKSALNDLTPTSSESID